MESMQRWGEQRNLRIEPYSLDIVPELVHLARYRLPNWADRIYIGNIRNWRPMNERFDFVMIRPEYAPKNAQAALVSHVIQNVLKPDGRLIVFIGAEETELRIVESSITEHGFAVNGRVEVPHSKDARLVRRLFWIDGTDI